MSASRSPDQHNVFVMDGQITSEADESCDPLLPPRQRGRRTKGRPQRLFAFMLLGFVPFVVLLWPGSALIRRSCNLARIWAPAAVWRSPEAVVASLESSGPVFIKLAQWLSTRRDLLSNELCDAMGKLHERVSCTASTSDLRLAERSVPGLQIGTLLGGGCIAQVYAGKMLNPSGYPVEVAVKVRRDGVLSLLETDIQLLRWAGQAVEYFRPELKWLAFQSAIDNFGEYLVQQVDLRMEAANAKQFASNFQRSAIHIPSVIAATESVMVTSMAYGVSLSTFTKQNHSAPLRKQVFEVLIDAMARMILHDGFIHGDLHPGNVFVMVEPPSRMSLSKQPTARITLIDMGIAINMSRNLHTFARESMTAALHMDPLALGQALTKLHTKEGLVEHVRDMPGLERKVGCLLLSGCFMVDEDVWGEVFSSWEDYSHARVSLYFTMMISYLSEHRVRVSPTLWSIMTAFALIEGSIAELGYGINVLRAATPYILSPADLIGRVASSLRFALSEAKHDKEMPNYNAEY